MDSYSKDVRLVGAFRFDFCVNLQGASSSPAVAAAAAREPIIVKSAVQEVRYFTFRKGLFTFRGGLFTFKGGLFTFRRGLFIFRGGLFTFRGGLFTFTMHSSPSGVCGSGQKFPPACAAAANERRLDSLGAYQNKIK
jgi:hypothetical protein